MKRRIFATYADEPIKNIKTPIRRFNGDPDEDNDVITTQYTDAEITASMSIELLQHIRTLLLLILVVKIICLCVKK